MCYYKSGSDFMESVLKYFEEKYGVFECFNGCLDSFIFEKETERYIDILMEW